MLKVIYAGTPEFAVPALQSLIDSSCDVVAVYTQPDRPAGRGRQLQPGPVKSCALDAGLTVEQPLSFKLSEDVERFQSYQADLMVVAAYGIILPEVILNTPRLGCVNIHASLLPRWRGAAPIQRAILAGDQVTGITLMQMDQGLDTGLMLATAALDIHPQDTAAQLHDALKVMGADLLMKNIDVISSRTIKGAKQDDSLACYASKLTKQEALIDWQKSAQSIHREVRAFNPWPVSHTTLDGKPVKIWKAELTGAASNHPPGSVLSHHKKGLDISTGEGVLRVTQLQFPGKKIQVAGEIINSRDLTSEHFGD